MEKTETAHRVDGIGKQITPDETLPFNPEVFEQAIHGLQHILHSITRVEDRAKVEDYSPNHELGTKDEQKTITAGENTSLYDVLRTLPKEWNTSVVDDQSWDNNYIVSTNFDCGGGVLVYAYIRVHDGMISSIEGGHTKLTNPSDSVEVGDFTLNTPSRKLLHATRVLEQSVTKAYANTLENDLEAFDHIATKPDMTFIGKRSRSKRERIQAHSRSDWAAVRDVQPETIDDNVRGAKEALLELPGTESYTRSGQAMVELPEAQKDDADVVLI